MNAIEARFFGEDDETSLRDLAGSSQAFQLARSMQLKPFPTEVLRLAQVLDDPEFQLSDVVARFESLPVLAAKVVRMANSPIYASRRPIDDIGQAVGRLGARAVRELVLAVTARDQFPDLGGTGEAIQRHSAQVAQLVRLLGRLQRRLDRPNAFLCALLHDVGKLLLLQSGEFRYLPNGRTRAGTSAWQEERAELGFDHAVLGALALRGWGIPDPVSRVVAWHHDPGAALNRGGDVALLVALVHVAEEVSDALDQFGELPADRAAELGEHSMVQHLRLTSADLVDLADAATPDRAPDTGPRLQRTVRH